MARTNQVLNGGQDLNPSGAGVWELRRHGVSRPFIGGRYEPPAAG